MKKLCYVISQGRDANGLATKFKKYLDILEHRSSPQILQIHLF